MTSSRSPWRRLQRNPAVVLSAVILVLVAFSAIFGPALMPRGSAEVTRASFLPPSKVHVFGTDLNGRDLLYRVLIGARISLLVGVAGASISFVVGIVYGMVAGYVGGHADSLMMRFVDILYAIPRLIFLLVLISALDPILRRLMVEHGLQGVDQVFEDRDFNFLSGSDRMANDGTHRSPNPESEVSTICRCRTKHWPNSSQHHLSAPSSKPDWRGNYISDSHGSRGNPG